MAAVGEGIGGVTDGSGPGLTSNLAQEVMT